MSTAASPFAFARRVYPIVDAAHSGSRSAVELAAVLLAAGVPLLQLRAKDLTTRAFIDLAQSLRDLCRSAGAHLLVNDRADIARLVGAAGVHLGQNDLPPADARRILGPGAIIGFSTHNLEQVRAADRFGCVDYLGFGPVFPTTSKENPDPCQGLEGLQAARGATSLPIVAIGGITARSAVEVLAAGADAVAMIGALALAPDPTAIVRSLA